MCSDDCGSVFVRATALVSAVRQRLYGHQLANVPQVQLSYKSRLKAFRDIAQELALSQLQVLNA